MNTIHRHLNAVKDLETIGNDMGGKLWQAARLDWATGDYHYHSFTDSPKASKEEQFYDYVKFRIDAGKTVHVTYEAGRYGFEPARILRELGASVYIVPVHEAGRGKKKRSKKTDRLDAKKLAEVHPDDYKKKKPVYIPTIEEEERRHALREMERLERHKSRLNNQIIALFDLSPITGVSKHRHSKAWSLLVDGLRERPVMQKRFTNMIAELEQIENIISDWEDCIQELAEAHQKSDDASKELLDQMTQFKGIAGKTAQTISWELCNFERFKNGRHLSSFLGLTPIPYESGTMELDLGISKAGRPALRAMLIQLAWRWVKWQPESDLVKKWKDKLDQKGKSRRRAIVALARQLMVALFRHVRHGEEIPGAVINKPLETTG